MSVDASVLKQYAGAFEGAGLPFPLNIVEKDNKLFLRLHRDIELVPESRTKFYIAEPDVEIQVEYVLTENKEVSHVYLIEGGVKWEAKRKS